MTRCLLLVVPVALIGLTLGGCAADNPHELTLNELLRDTSPELQSTAMSYDQRRASTARAIDTTSRQILDDWDSLWLVDRASRMSEHPVP